MRSILFLICTLTAFPPSAWCNAQHKPKKTESGVIAFQPGEQKDIPELYRLKTHKFPYTLTFKQNYRLSGFDISHLTFPSPVTSPHTENNTVHADYYRPKGLKKFPCVVVLHITGGDQTVSRLISTHLARNGIGAVFMQMAYYGPRRPREGRVRMLSLDAKRTMSAVRQTVLDIRRAAAWMESRPEIDKERIGIVGTSLGGFMAALSSEMEPKFKKIAILLAGGGFIDAYYDHPKAALARLVWELLGGTKQQAQDIFAPYDPLTCAVNLKNRDVLMISAGKDEIVPPKMAKAFWRRAGRPKIIWIDTGHYGAALYMITMMRSVVAHIKER